MFWRPGSGRRSDSHVLRPMITAWPVVSARKCAAGRRAAATAARWPAPITPLRATATISATRRTRRGRGRGHGGRDGDGLAAGTDSRRVRRGESLGRRRERRRCHNALDYNWAPSRVLPALVPQVHPAGLPARQPAARLCAGRAHPVARPARHAKPRGGAAGIAGGALEPPLVRAGDDARTARAAADHPRGSGAARGLRPDAAGVPADDPAAVAAAAR